MVSPVQLREPQLRGLAEPFSVTMDFGELPANRPLVLALNDWLRFGGGMANIAASLDANLPFPFPTLEAELPDGSWQKVDVDVGAPCGKTKTILVDLENKLPTGARQLRITTAFEIYWDWRCHSLRTSCRPNPPDMSATFFSMWWAGTRMRISTWAKNGASNRCRSTAWRIRPTITWFVRPPPTTRGW